MSIEILANKQRYDEPTLIQHAERLKMLIAQFAADPALLCGDVDIMLPVSMRSWRRSTPLRLRFQKPRLARWWQNKRQKHRMLRRWQMRVTSSAIGKCASRWWRWRICCVSAALNRGQRGGGTTALGLLTLALHAIVEAGAARLPLDTGYPDDRLKMMLEDARPSLLITTDDQLPRFSDVPNLTKPLL